MCGGLGNTLFDSRRRTCHSLLLNYFCASMGLVVLLQHLHMAIKLLAETSTINVQSLSLENRGQQLPSPPKSLQMAIYICMICGPPAHLYIYSRLCPYFFQVCAIIVPPESNISQILSHLLVSNMMEDVLSVLSHRDTATQRLTQCRSCIQHLPQLNGIYCAATPSKGRRVFMAILKISIVTP